MMDFLVLIIPVIIIELIVTKYVCRFVGYDIAGRLVEYISVAIVC
jgi:hypothetical protein